MTTVTTSNPMMQAQPPRRPRPLPPVRNGWLSMEHAAAKLGIGRSKAYEVLLGWVADGKLRRVRLGVTWRYSDTDIDRIMAALAEEQA